MSSSAGAGPPSSGPRRSARTRGRCQLPGGVPSMPASGAPPAAAGRPSSLPRRSRRGASPDGPSLHAREMDDFQPLVAVLDDDKLKQPAEVEERKKQGKEVLEAEGPEQVDEDDDALKEAPFWFPDGWIINVRHGEGGSIYRYYTSPVSEYTFSTNMEALNYLFSEIDERVLESQACAEDNKLHRMHTWLPDGWVIEVRAGGKMMDKMYKFYVHLPSGMRFFSKEDALRYVNEGESSKCNVKGLCDTSSEDNILAQVEFNPDGLPEGWVKEIIFRKCRDGTRKDSYYTDPVSHHVFRTLKSVMSYLETGEISKHAFIPKTSVMDMYSFDKCTDLPERMLKRVKVQGKTKHKSTKELVLDKEIPDDQTSNHSEGGISAGLIPLSEPKEKKFKIVKATGRELVNSQAKRPRGRPRKISKQADERTSDCAAKSSHNETAHIVVKNEFDMESGEQMSKEKTLESNKMVKHATVMQGADNNSDLAKSISMFRRDKLGVVTDSHLHEQENGNSTEASEKSTSFSAHKFYMRRNSSQASGLKKE